MKCSCCNKKIGIIVFECKCNLSFCTKCRYPEIHKCTFNYKEYNKKILSKKLERITGTKIIKI